jgi:Ca2+-binding RTX toxin-like protein
MSILTGNSKNNSLSGGNGSDTLSGLGGNDKLSGKGGNDILIGGTGDDYLAGSYGSDTYNFNLGDGADTIYEYDSGANTDVDRLVFGTGITSDKITVQALSNGSLVLSIKNTDDSIKILDFFSNDGNQIEEFKFSNGTIWTADDVAALASVGSGGNDYLPGSGGHDTILGLAGDDRIHGQAGNDNLDGGLGNDQIWGDDGADTLTGGLGNDEIYGGKGSDTYLFAIGDGEDVVGERDDNGSDYGINSYTDTIVFGSGIAAGDVSVRQNSSGDAIFSIDGSDDSITISDFLTDKGAQVEEVHFADGTVWTADDLAVLMMAGSSSDDYLRGTSGADTIAGLAGDDSIYGLKGNDDLTGGTGDDYIEGSRGSDTYHFDLGDGADTLYEFDSNAYYYNTNVDTDILVFGAGITAADVSVHQTSKGALVISLVGTNDSVTISKFFGDLAHQIEGVHFSDGTEWDVSDLVALATQGSSSDDYIRGTGNADTITGLAGDDHIYGLYGNDDLTGGTGDDYLDGSRGSDTYHFDLGDGADTIYEYDGNVYYNQTSVDSDILVFGTGITAADLRVSQTSGGDLVISLDGTDDSVTISQFFSNLSDQIEGVHFSDGTEWDASDLIALATQGSSSNDYLRGTDNADTIAGLAGDDHISGLKGNDDLTGGTGDDDINGSRGSDTYHFALGDGADTLYEYDSKAYYSQSNADTDVLVFGTGIAAEDLSVHQTSDGDLVISISGTNDSITVREFFNSLAFQIEGVHFSDGTEWDASNLIALATQGSSSDDYLRGTNNADTIAGLAGDDTIFGYRGDDDLTGGTGDDYINGSRGSDTYHFALGDGADLISEYDNNAYYYHTNIDTDILVLGTGITKDAVKVRGDGDGDLVITISGTSDKITINEGAARLESQIEELHFTDGTIWNAAKLQSLQMAGTSGTDYLWGSSASQVISGKAGADQLYGLDGNDILVGGKGADGLNGGNGKDTASYADASAAVTANLASYKLNAGDAAGDRYSAIENLLGSKFNDKLTGNTVANFIDGGKGNDILTGGKGADHFIFGKSYGKDSISDFEASGSKHDVIDLSNAAGISSYIDLIKHHMSDAGNHVLITATDGSTLKILNVEMTNLAEADFLF